MTSARNHTTAGVIAKKKKSCIILVFIYARLTASDKVDATSFTFDVMFERYKLWGVCKWGWICALFSTLLADGKDDELLDGDLPRHLRCLSGCAINAQRSRIVVVKWLRTRTEDPRSEVRGCEAARFES